MHKDNRWNNRQRDWQDDPNEGSERDEQGWRNRQGYRSDEWQDRDRNEYNRRASQSDYGSSMSSMGEGQGAYYPTEGGYMHDSRYADYGRDYRRYTDNYYRHQRDNSWENQNQDSRRFMERGRYAMQQPRYGQSYQSAYGNGGTGDHMGYGEKGAQYRDEFHGRYGAGNYDEQNERERGQRGYGRREHSSQGNYNRGGYGDHQGYGTGHGRDLGSRSYFMNTNSDAYDRGDNFWNIGNYGERRTNEDGYGYGDGYDHRDNSNRNLRNYTW